MKNSSRANSSVRCLKVIWPATAMVLLTEFVGLYVASALYLGFYMRWVGRHSWITVIVLAVSASRLAPF